VSDANDVLFGAAPAPAIPFEQALELVSGDRAAVEGAIAEHERALEALYTRHEQLTGGRAEPHVDDPLQWLLAAAVPAAVVVDVGVAREGPCQVVDLGAAGQLAYHHGVVGALNADQQALYCLEREVLQLTPERRARIAGYQQAAASCAGGGAVDERLGCLVRELERRGERLS